MVAVAVTVLRHRHDPQRGEPFGVVGGEVRRFAAVARRPVARVHRERAFRRGEIRASCRLALAREFPVARDDPERGTLHAARIEQRLGDAPVAAGARRRRGQLVRARRDERVRERERPAAQVRFPNEAARDQLVERMLDVVLGEPAGGRDDVERELAADRRRDFGDGALRRVEPLEAGRDRRAEAARRALRGRDDARLDEAAEQLLHEQRVPFAERG